ncbi:putative NF-X1 finger and helicase domain protein [Gregarina niphandrodes]|uniref:NF-X1 finger and helicase domain protein n=1 Tax=Gregarina niphandrodes TaxID=110365 RepID=A0A023B9C1_GRENI|nr:putative NF-X1 finger and helicase domain protein [Gregarina niphandrodes]EZG72218.1 putative NF-X1 finger and helicase domain protein [Gregarina niphandrodes]|eukprot:XP_011129794.1 putative NF-X1 finger and helicase domain protein [Gregarina niphandrodes]
MPARGGPNGPTTLEQLLALFQKASFFVRQDEDMAQRVVLKLAEEGGLQRIEQLADAVPTEVTSLSDSYSLFERGVMPLQRVFTDAYVSESLLLERSVATVFNFMYGFSGVRGMKWVEFTTTVLERTRSGEIETLQKQIPLVERIEQIRLSIHFFERMVMLNSDAKVQVRLARVTERLQAVLKGVYTPELSWLLQKTRSCMERVLDLFEVGNDLPSQFQVIATARTQDPDSEVDGSEDATASNDSGGGNSSGDDAVVSQERPRGAYRRKEAPGGRHDNDHADISRIMVLPTYAEVQCMRAPYLPPVNPRNWHLSGLAGLLDRQFRLLRADTVGQLIGAVSSELHEGDAKETGKGKQGGTRVYRDLRVTRLNIEPVRGLEITVEFPQPEDQRLFSWKPAEWWRVTRRLQLGSLVCLLGSCGILVFCTVVEKPAKKGNRSPTLLEMLSDDPHTAKVLLHVVEMTGENVACVFDAYRRQHMKSDLRLVEFPGVVLESFRSTLEALKSMARSMTMPFAQFLAPEDPARALQVPPPTYSLAPDFAFDLSCLKKRDGDFSSRTVTEGPLLKVGETFDVAELEEVTTLDHGQAVALINALQRSIALIQGPPGTGKSFTGVSLIKVLLANKQKCDLGPIVCVCYTNHALDQLLEDLIGKEITKSVIRIGGGCKSEVIDSQYRYFDQVHQFMETRGERDALYRARKKLAGRAKELKQCMSSMSCCDRLEDYLSEYHPRHYDQLFSLQQSEVEQSAVEGLQQVREWLYGMFEGRVSEMVDPEIDSERPVKDLLEADLWTLTAAERSRLLDYWFEMLDKDACNSITGVLFDYVEDREDFYRVRDEKGLRLLQASDVVGLTTTGLTRNLETLRRLRAKVLLCEEAGEVLEAHLLTSLLPSVEHVILIGDHQQLRPHSQNYDLSVESWQGAQYSFDVSLFERLVSPRPGTGMRIPYDTLATQRRMHPSISRLISSTIYPDLLDAPSVSVYPPVVGMRKRLFWFDHREPEAAADASPHGSRFNDFEVQMAVGLVKHLVRQGVYGSKQIAVLTPYLGQLIKLKKALGSHFVIALGEGDQDDLLRAGLAADVDVTPTATGDTVIGDAVTLESTGERRQAVRSSLLSSLRIATVDNFQGEEADVVIISVVRSNEERSCGFLKSANRINVLLSRARHGMYILGNSATARTVPMWAQIIRLLSQDDCIGPALPLACVNHPDIYLEVARPNDFIMHAPEGGCSQQCPKPLGCGHKCSNKCHPDWAHALVPCLVPCSAAPFDCGHPCPKRCGQPCPDRCEILLNVDITLQDCGHRLTKIACWEHRQFFATPTAPLGSTTLGTTALGTTTALYKCRERVAHKFVFCGHEQEVECWRAAPGGAECAHMCGQLLPCGHSCAERCSDCTVSGCVPGLCSELCGRAYDDCSHTCAALCHGDIDCAPCGAPCVRGCTHGPCRALCSQPCTPCTKPCIAHCVHSSCSMPCSAPCDRPLCNTRCEKPLACGHRCPSVCGEPCPEPKYCQECATEEVKATPVANTELYLGDPRWDDGDCGLFDWPYAPRHDEATAKAARGDEDQATRADHETARDEEDQATRADDDQTAQEDADQDKRTDEDKGTAGLDPLSPEAGAKEAEEWWDSDGVLWQTYRRVRLWESPCIFLPCGHFFSVAHLDLEVAAQLASDGGPDSGGQSGEFPPTTGGEGVLNSTLPRSVEPISPFSVACVAVCPYCRGSLRTVARYGRVVRRALVDASVRRLLLQTTRWLLTMAKQLHSEPRPLGESLCDTQEVVARAIRFDTLELRGNRQSQANQLHRVLAKHKPDDWRQIRRRRLLIKEAIRQIERVEAPFLLLQTRIRQRRRHSRQHPNPAPQNADVTTSENADVTTSENADVTTAENADVTTAENADEHSDYGFDSDLVYSSQALKGHLLLMQEDTALLLEFTSACYLAGKEIVVDLTENRAECATLVAAAERVGFVEVQVEGLVCLAQLCASELRASSDGDTLTTQALDALDKAERLCHAVPFVALGLVDGVMSTRAAVRQRSFCPRLNLSRSIERLQTRLDAMQGNYLWYCCANGHPFAPTAVFDRCFECGAVRCFVGTNGPITDDSILYLDCANYQNFIEDVKIPEDNEEESLFVLVDSAMRLDVISPSAVFGSQNCVRLLDHLRGQEWYKDQMNVYHEAERAAEREAIRLFDHLSLEIRTALCHMFQKETLESPELYVHQARAIDSLLDGHDLSLSTSTASGKSLVFIAHGIDRLVKIPGSTLLAIYPTKALAQNQLLKWQEMVEEVKRVNSVHTIPCGVIDGDVEFARRHDLVLHNRIILTNFDFLHKTMAMWKRLDFIRRLVFIVVDEAHVCRGVFGAHAALTLRRVLLLNKYLTAQHTRDVVRKRRRILVPDTTQLSVLRTDTEGQRASDEGQPPNDQDQQASDREAGGQQPKVDEEHQQSRKVQLMTASATLGNPERHFELLTGRQCVSITHDGAPSGEKFYVLWDPSVVQHHVDEAPHGNATSVSRKLPITISPKVASTLLTPKRSSTKSDLSTHPFPEVLPKRVVSAPGLSLVGASITEDAVVGTSNLMSFSETFSAGVVERKESAIQDSIRLFCYFVDQNVRSFLFCNSRSLVEIIYNEVTKKLPFNNRVVNYRGGYTKESRRELESRMFKNEVIGVITTNALELGIDLGLLDVVITLGFEGSVSSVKQRLGRAGRADNRASIGFLVAFDSPVERYVVKVLKNDFWRKPPEPVGLNPGNVILLKQHLLCALKEINTPISTKVLTAVFGPPVLGAIQVAENTGEIRQVAHGYYKFAVTSRALIMAKTSGGVRADHEAKALDLDSLCRGGGVPVTTVETVLGTDLEELDIESMFPFLSRKRRAGEEPEPDRPTLADLYQIAERSEAKLHHVEKQEEGVCVFAEELLGQSAQAATAFKDPHQLVDLRATAIPNVVVYVVGKIQGGGGGYLAGDWRLEDRRLDESDQRLFADVVKGATPIDEVEMVNAFMTLFPGAVYPHRGVKYVVKEFNPTRQYAVIQKPREIVRHYTKAGDSTHWDVISVSHHYQVSLRPHPETSPVRKTSERFSPLGETPLGRAFGGETLSGVCDVFCGDVRVRVTVPHYYRVYVGSGGRRVEKEPLAIPDLAFVTRGLAWRLTDVVWKRFGAVRGLAAARLPSHLHETYVPTVAVHGLSHLLLKALAATVWCDVKEINCNCTGAYAVLPGTHFPRAFVYERASGLSLGIVDAVTQDLAQCMLYQCYSCLLACPCATADRTDGCPECVLLPTCSEKNDLISHTATKLLLQCALPSTLFQEAQPPASTL